MRDYMQIKICMRGNNIHKEVINSLRELKKLSVSLYTPNPKFPLYGG